MPYDIGPKIGIEGEAEFKRQIAEINTGIKTLGTEMKVVTSEFASNENSVEALTAKNDVLDRTVSSLNEKLATQQEMLRRSAQAYGEADSRTQKWQQDVNNTQAELNKSENAIRANTEQIEKLGKAGEGVGGLLRNGVNSLAESLTGKLGGALGMSSSQVKDLTTSLTGGSTAMGGLSSGALGAVAAVGALGTAVVALAAKLTDLAEAAGKQADEVLTLSTNYGMAEGDIQKFQYMAELTDTSLETITGSLSKLTRSMDSARDGTGGAAEAFAKLGISVTNSDGSLRSSNEVFMQTIDALGRVGNATERDALTMEIFGRSAMELNSLIATGSAGISAYAQEAENAGYVMDDKMLESLGKADDAAQRLDKATEGLKNTLGAAFAPVVTTVDNGLASLASTGTEVLLFFGHATEGLVIMGKQLGATAADLLGIKGSAEEAAEGFNEIADAANNARNAIVSIRDLTKEDLMTPQQKSYSDYVQRALKYQQETGQQVTIYSPQAMQQGYQTQINLQLDGYTVGRAMTGSVNNRNYVRGSGI